MGNTHEPITPMWLNPLNIYVYRALIVPVYKFKHTHASCFKARAECPIMGLLSLVNIKFSSIIK